MRQVELVDLGDDIGDCEKENRDRQQPLHSALCRASASLLSSLSCASPLRYCDRASTSCLCCLPPRASASAALPRVSDQFAERPAPAVAPRAARWRGVAELLPF